MGLRLDLLDLMRNTPFLKSEQSEPFKICERILYIIRNAFESDAHYLDDYTEHSLLCALVKGDCKEVIRYSHLHSFWNNIKNGYIIDYGKKGIIEKDWKIPSVLKERLDNKTLPDVIRMVVNAVVAEKKLLDIEQFL